MIRALLETVVRLKNPKFALDPAVSNLAILQLFWSKTWAWLRGLRLIFSGQWSGQIFIGRGVRLFNTVNMRFGRWVQLEDHVYLSALGKQALELGNNVKIGAYSRLIISTTFNNVSGFIKIGDNVGLGEFAYLGGAGGLEIGADCIIGQYLSCHPENHHFDQLGVLIRHQGVSRQGIKIGENCWIGAKVTILDGVTIGNNCVIAAGAVVNRSFPDNTVIGGVPARILKSIEKTESVLIP